MKTRKRMSAMVMAFIIAFTTGYTPVAAAEHIHDEACGYRSEVPCDHTTHDDACGYKEATEGSACNHEHDENCYGQVESCQHIHEANCFAAVVDATPSNTTEPANCTHECTEATGCITKELDCPHNHDKECGYEAGTDGQPCKHDQGEHDETCGYRAAAPCNTQAGSNKMKKILQKTKELPRAETLLTTAECVIPSETANTPEAVTNWIKTTWLRGIPVLDDAVGKEYGVGIEDLEIVTLPDLAETFTPAVDGTEQNPEGTAGKFTFSVVVPGIDNQGPPPLTVSKTCKITPKRYTLPDPPILPQIQVKSTTLTSATAGEPYSFSLDSLLADAFSEDLVSWTLPSTTSLPEGLTFTAGEGTISGTPTTAGNYTLSDILAAATGGQYQASIFSFALTVNEAVQYPTPVILASGETVDFKDGVVHVDKDKTVHLEANLPANAPAHSLQWQIRAVSEEGENTFRPITNETRKEYDYIFGPNNIQIRCVATYAGNEERESVPVTIICRIAEIAAVTGAVTTENGTPVAGWNVIATDKNNNLIAEAETGKNGEYRFEALQANENYTLSVEGVTGDNSTPVTTGGQGSQLSKNITLATGNIPGATSANLQTSDGIPVVSEFIPTGNITGDNTLSAESYSPTEQDYIAAIDQVSPGAKKVEGEMVEIPEEDIEVIENFQFQGVDYKIGELVLINHVFYIVKSAHADSGGRAYSLYLLNMSDGLDYCCRENQTLPGMYINDSKYDITYEKGKIIYINGVKYYNNYKAANTVFPTVYTLVRWDGNGVPVEAGVYEIANTGALKGKPGARFNKGYSPSELPKDIVDEITPVTDTFITRDDKLLEMLVRFSSDLTVTNNESQETDIHGTTSITGLDNIGSNVIAVHKGENGYEVGTAIKNGFAWYGSSRSPFMIFSVNEINTEIPARLIPTDSGDGSGDSSSSSDGGSSSSDDSTYNPDILRGTWIRTDAGIWKFRLTSGTYAKSRWGLVDGLWYYFDSEGKMLTGWQFLNNRWYYLCTEETSKLAAGRKEGAMLTGWYYDPMYQGWFYMDASGAMLTGWKEIGGRWYYFYENGVMAADTEVDGYKLGPDGAWIV